MRVGMIGTGLMGLPMAKRLQHANLLTVAYNRSPEKLQVLTEVQPDVQLAHSPAEVLQACDCVVLMLSDAAAIAETLLSDATQPHLTGKTILQMGTIGASQSQQLQQAIQAAGGDYFEAPVLGSIPEATQGTLLVMVGGSEAQFTTFAPVLRCFSPEPLLVGPVGHAAAIKLALNQLIGALTTAFATSLEFLQQQSVAVDPFMQVLRQSALYAPTFDKKLARMVERQFERPNFPTKHLLKDTNLFLSEAESLKLETVSVTAVQTILQRAIALGLAELDYAAIAAAVDLQPNLNEDLNRQPNLNR